MMSEPKRLHPTVILFNLMKVMKEFLFFLIPGFVVFSGKALLYYLFILLGCIIVFIGFITISWYRYTYQVKEDELRIEYGVFVRNKRYISKHRIQSIDLTQSVLHRMLDIVKVEIQTAGSGEGAEASIQAVTREEGDRLRNELKRVESVVQSEDDVPSRPFAKITNKRLFIAGTTSGSVGAILAIMAFMFSKLEQMIPAHVIDYTVEWMMRTSMVLISGFALILFIVSWILGIVRTIIKYGNFTITKDDGELLITRGLLEKRQLTIPLRRIQAIGMKESMIRQPLGYITVFAEVAGSTSEQGKDYSTILFPIMKKCEVEPFLQQFVPSHARVEDKSLTKLPRRARKYYLLRSMAPTLVVAVGLTYMIPSLLWLSILLLAASMYVGYLQHKDGGYQLTGERITIQYRTLSKVTMRIHRKRIQAFELKQHKIHMMERLATVKLSIIGILGVGNHFKLKELEKDDARHLAHWYSFRTS